MINTALTYRKYGIPEQVLTPETGFKGSLAEGMIRVKMLFSPVNASDLIPVTGAYQHRIILPQVAGYEGVGMVTDTPRAYRHLIGQRVLALRGEGTWQTYVDVPAVFAIPVPDYIEDSLAARAYINPVAALLMVTHFSPAGKHVLITAAGSECAVLLGQWAIRAGALPVTGVHRSAKHISALEQCGIKSVSQADADGIRRAAACADVVYDAVGGKLAEDILDVMPSGGIFISYGLLSGQIFYAKSHLPKIHWFHVRHYIDAPGIDGWHAMFRDLWPQLSTSYTNGIRVFTPDCWKSAIAAYRSPDRNEKPVIQLVTE